MLLVLNGRFLPESEASIPVFDRGFLYGDGLFETMLVRRGRPFRWDAHLARLRRGAALLGLEPPFTDASLRALADELIQRNQLPDATLRLQLTRGVGARGYSPTGKESPTWLLTLHPATPVEPGQPPATRLATVSLRVPAGDPLLPHKTTDKLRQIVARREAEQRGADEALLLNTDGHLAEAASANLGWIEHRDVCTPPLGAGALAGITRALLPQLSGSLGLGFREVDAPPAALPAADAVFLTLTTQGVTEAVALDGQPLNRSPLVAALHRAYWALVDQDSNEDREGAEDWDKDEDKD